MSILHIVVASLRRTHLSHPSRKVVVLSIEISRPTMFHMLSTCFLSCQIPANARASQGRKALHSRSEIPDVSKLLVLSVNSGCLFAYNRAHCWGASTSSAQHHCKTISMSARYLENQTGLTFRPKGSHGKREDSQHSKSRAPRHSRWQGQRGISHHGAVSLPAHCNSCKHSSFKEHAPKLKAGCRFLRNLPKGSPFRRSGATWTSSVFGERRFVCMLRGAIIQPSPRTRQSTSPCPDEVYTCCWQPLNSPHPSLRTSTYGRTVAADACLCAKTRPIFSYN